MLLIMFLFTMVKFSQKNSLGKAIQRRIGHASARTTSNFYDHVSEKLENSTVKHFNHFDPRNLRQKQS